MVKAVKGVALAVVLGSLVGCAVPGMSVGTPRKVVSPVQAAKGALQVKVAALGKRGYGVLALSDELAFLTLNVQVGRYAVKRTLSREELFNGTVQTFDGVPVGEATLSVQVYDAARQLIGDGTEMANVRAGQVAEVPVRVQALKQTGGVTAVISFDDEPKKALRMDAEGFRIADADGDGYLNGDEFAGHFPYVEIASGERGLACGPEVNVPGEVTNELPQVTPDVGPAPFTLLDSRLKNRRGSSSVRPVPVPVASAEPLRMMPGMPEPGAVAIPSLATLWFGCLDRNADGYLDRDEFIGVVIAPHFRPFRTATSRSRPGTRTRTDG